MGTGIKLSGYYVSAYVREVICKEIKAAFVDSTPTCYKQSRGEIPTELINTQALSTSSPNTDSSETPLYQLPSVLPNMHISMTYIMWSPKPFRKG